MIADRLDSIERRLAVTESGYSPPSNAARTIGNCSLQIRIPPSISAEEFADKLREFARRQNFANATISYGPEGYQGGIVYLYPLGDQDSAIVRSYLNSRFPGAEVRNSDL
jgi:hypothetical protein